MIRCSCNTSFTFPPPVAHLFTLTGNVFRTCRMFHLFMVFFSHVHSHDNDYRNPEKAFCGVSLCLIQETKLVSVKPISRPVSANPLGLWPLKINHCLLATTRTVCLFHLNHLDNSFIVIHKYAMGKLITEQSQNEHQFVQLKCIFSANPVLFYVPLLLQLSFFKLYHCKPSEQK